MSDTVQVIDLHSIVPGDNDRGIFKQVELEQLAANIATNGLAQPITLRPVGQGFQIVAGERRFRAYKLLAEKDASRFGQIPAIVRTMSDEQADAIMLAENIQRAQLNPIEEANAFDKRIKKYGWTFSKCAQECNVSVDKVRNRLLLLNLMPEVQTMVAHSHMPLAHAQAMGVLDKNYQMVALRALKGKHLTAEKFQEVVSGLQAQQNQTSMFDMAALELQVQTQVENLHQGVNPGQTFLSITLNNCATLFLMVQHKPGQTVQIDERFLRQAITISGG
jgi:ParB family chromosome partitioning protein